MELVVLASIFHHAFGLSARLEVVEILVAQALARIQMIQILQEARRSPVILTIPMTMIITLPRKIHRPHNLRSRHRAPRYPAVYHHRHLAGQ